MTGDEQQIRDLVATWMEAFMWSRLEVRVTPPGGKAVKRAGHTLTVFRKVGGKWLLARDANLLADEG